jgi:transcriptional regulator with XRE-family HTH domain
MTTRGYAGDNFLGMRRPLPGFRRAREQRRPHYIAEWRAFRGMTQEDLAEAMGTTKATVSRVEDRTHPYSQDFLETAAEVLAVHQSVLLARPPGEADRLPAVAPPAPAASKRRIKSP